MSPNNQRRDFHSGEGSIMQQRFPSRRRLQHAGFSLIELLVVVSIIALLLSLLLPSLAGAKRTAQSTACAANIHGLLEVTRNYLTDNNDTYPVNGMLFPHPITTAQEAQFNLNQSDPSVVAWEAFCNKPDNSSYTLPNGVLFPLANNSYKLFMCPNDDGSRTSTAALTMTTYPVPQPPDPANPDYPRVGANTNGYWSYSVNTVLNEFGRSAAHQAPIKSWGDPLQETKVLREQTFVVFIEEANTSNFNDEVFDPPILNSTVTGDATSTHDTLTDRHDGGGNLGFADGHAEKLNAVLFNVQSVASPFNQWFFPTDVSPTVLQAGS
jgi:prepilin-type N-terminal cleavage/methylation domain-containing protein/prepilin-type processing-associated H-X9-DG protein